MDKRHRQTKSTGIATLVVLLFVSTGCAMTPADREAREYERMDAELRAAERYETLKHRCRAAGGVLMVEGNWGKTKPRASEMKMAKCGSTIDNALSQSLSLMP
ncbi:MAG TPA: hypothetical protein VF389_00220 [Woeseiaceae bacterium]